jgi:SNF2 family DNA or RNA helicase
MIELVFISDQTLAVVGDAHNQRGHIRQVGGRWDKKINKWTIPNMPSYVHNLISQVPVEVRVPDAVRELIDRQHQSLLAKSNPEANPPVPGAKMKPWKHQQIAYWFAKRRKRALLAMDMGTGKSAAVVWLAQEMDRVLITCPKSVLTVWPEQFELHGQKPMPVTVLRGTGTKKLKMALSAPERGVIVVNHESLWRDPLWDWVRDQDWDMLVCDESHRAKSAGGKFSGKLALLAKDIPCVLGLTGTPMPHSPLDIYGQARFIDPGIFGANFNNFKNRYANLIKMTGAYGSYQKVIGFINQDELAQNLAQFSYQVAASDVLDLPEKQHLYRTFELDRHEWKAYNEIKNDLISESKDRTITAANALVKVIRLAQICGGHATDDAGGLVEIGSSKEKALTDVLEDLQEPVVVFCRFRADLDAVHRATKKAGLTSLELSGRRNELEEWKLGDADVIAVQIQAGGAGVDLTRARICVYYSVGYSLGDYEQSLARVYRPGQTRPVIYYHLVAEDTIEAKLYKALESKKDIVDFVLSLLS